jgi:magnesium transporter
MLNNRFAKLAAYLTIVGTALLIPNTIATMLGNSVWVYGPENLPFYLLIMIGATLAGSIFMWYWIKKKGFLPEDKELSKL